MQHILSIAMILTGAVVMLFNLVKAKELHILTPFIPERSKAEIIRSLRLHRGLMLFFLLGYCVVAGVFALRLPFVDELLVGLVFLLGAIFVLLGLHIQARMLLEIKTPCTACCPSVPPAKKSAAPMAARTTGPRGAPLKNSSPPRPPPISPTASARIV